MFFIYVIIFIAIVATPFVVQSGWWIFSEDEMEALALLVAGVVSFGIYRLRDYQFFQTIADRMHIQRLFARAQRIFQNPILTSDRQIAKMISSMIFFLICASFPSKTTRTLLHVSCSFYRMCTATICTL